ncbi:HEAT repeat domain-containing protein [Methanocalculus sp.]|uniref:HEAT repeat domain-containing protein n=1 Tax=Methanocalculus sp. TaxID=2004547 RepID=UPI00271A9B79|nr:HEAT repeat domain-containing protein [Methanocalculus sp.]MDO8841501.1 HEAT repeat domain-containing protein [Methanocalculus sp.]
MSTLYFCPFCGKESCIDESICSDCSQSLDQVGEKSFEERLLLTLRHPIPQQRMLAILILGRRRYEPAVPVFEELITSGQDVYTLREMVSALSLIDTHEGRRLLRRLRDHPSPVVRKAAEEAVFQSHGGHLR